MASRKKNDLITPFDYWQTNYQISKMMAEASTVMGMRMLGMAGLWSVAGDENTVMMTEKMKAFTVSAMNAQKAILAQKDPGQVILEAVKPIAKVTAANHKRLSKRGPKFR